MTPLRLIGRLAQTAITFAVLILLAILAFYITVFVVSTGASLAGYDPSGDFVILSAALLVVAALLGGIPFGTAGPQHHPEADDGSPSGFQ